VTVASGLPWPATLTVHCAWAGRAATVECLTYDGRTPVGVLSCSAFAPGAGLLCGTPCVESGAVPRAAGETAAARR
jgi:hypothetical protein